jgi:hypothetical protein
MSARLLPEGVVTNDNGPMQARPELAVYIARVVNASALLDRLTGQLVTYMLGADAHVGMKMYQALSGSGAKRDVLRAVGRDRLNDDLKQRLKRLIVSSEAASKQRNKVVHGIWAYSEKYPDDLIWSDPASTALQSSAFWSYYAQVKNDKDHVLKLLEYKGGRAEPHVLYGAAEFEAILDAALTVINDTQAFAVSVHDFQKVAGD